MTITIEQKYAVRKRYRNRMTYGKRMAKIRNSYKAFKSVASRIIDEYYADASSFYDDPITIAYGLANMFEPEDCRQEYADRLEAAAVKIGITINGFLDWVIQNDSAPEHIPGMPGEEWERPLSEIMNVLVD